MYDDDSDSTEDTTMSRKAAIQALKSHGHSDKESRADFDATLGVRAEYEVSEVRDWLGY